MSKTSVYMKENSQFLYSIILIVMIPVLIIANTLWQIRSSQDSMTYELHRKAVLAESILGGSITDSLNNRELLQTKLDNLVKDNKEIKEITILEQTNEGFVAVASTNSQDIGIKFTSEDYITTWVQDNPTAMLVNDTTKAPSERFWSVTSPLKDLNSGKKVAMVNMKVSLADIDALNKKNLDYSLIILIITVFLVLLLLVNHFRFFEYAILFKKLKEVDKMKDDFISIASHEMKTPMAAIKGYLSIMFEGLGGKFDQKGKEHLIKIFAGVERLDLLVLELLDVSRLEQGRMQFDLQPHDISKVIEDSIKTLEGQAEEKGLKLEEQKLAQMPPVFIDSDRLRQVVDNLIGNAIKYTQKGNVTVTYKIEDDDLLTIIKDTGIGMNAQDRKSLFTKFYRIKNEKTADVPGTGLGLWIAREIVRKMDGDILVDSMENVGSQFIIKLPFMKEK